jgi:hypothetical protein
MPPPHNNTTGSTIVVSVWANTLVRGAMPTIEFRAKQGGTYQSGVAKH